MKSICVFNNKGGVGKTTLLCNLASWLQLERGKRVLVIDADPQCNATAYMLREAKLDQLYSKEQGTINDLIRPLKRGRGYLETEIPILKSEGFGVDLIAGDPKFSIAEDFLSRDWVDAVSGQERGLRTTMIFAELLQRLKDYDYVFFDVGPSLGAINRTVLLASDFFLIPMSSDIFSLRGLQNIEIAVGNWKADLKQGLNTFARREGEPFLVGDEAVSVNLQFVGYVTQQYTAKTVDGKKQPVNAYEKIIKKIGPSMQRHIVSPFNNSAPLEYSIGEIPSLQSVVPMSQSACKPIFALGSSDGVRGAHFEKVRDFAVVIDNIAHRVYSNIEELS